jgi:hypothetical protein
MEILNSILLVIHILAVIGILALLLLQWNKSPRKLNPGVLHSGLTALLAGLIMIGLRHSLTISDATKYPALDNTKFSIKLIILLIILVLGYRNVKKPILSRNIWIAMIALTVVNIGIASAWN